MVLGRHGTEAGTDEKGGPVCNTCLRHIRDDDNVVGLAFSSEDPCQRTSALFYGEVKGPPAIRRTA